MFAGRRWVRCDRVAVASMLVLALASCAEGESEDVVESDLAHRHVVVDMTPLIESFENPGQLPFVELALESGSTVARSEGRQDKAILSFLGCDPHGLRLTFDIPTVAGTSRGTAINFADHDLGSDCATIFVTVNPEGGLTLESLDRSDG